MLHRPPSSTTRRAVPSAVTTWRRTRRRRRPGSHHRSCSGHGPAQATTRSPAAVASDPTGPEAGTNRCGGADNTPRPSTVTGRPATSHTSTAAGSAWMAAGRGPGSAPGHGGPSAAAATTRDGSSDPSPSQPSNGTRARHSPGSRPPRHSGTRTDPGPNRPSTLLQARAARSSAADAPPQNPTWRPVAGTTSSGMRISLVIPEVGRTVGGPWSHPSNCHRTRSATAPGPSTPSSRQRRSSRSPCSVSTSTTTRVQARPRPDSRPWRASARDRAANAARSIRSTGGSKATDTARSGGIGLLSGDRSSIPEARRWASRPSAPKRARTSVAGRAANAPRVSNPRRTSTSASAGRPSTAGGSGARKAGVPPGGTTTAPPPSTTEASAVPAARPAANPPSATPIPQPGWSAADPTRSSSATATTRAVRRTRFASPPDRRTGPRTPKAHNPGRHTSSHGVTSPRAAATASNLRASRASSRSSTRTSGHLNRASRRRCPRATPAFRAATVVANTRPAARTTTGSEGSTPRAVNGQSGHRTTRVRTPPGASAAPLTPRS